MWIYIDLYGILWDYIELCWITLDEMGLYGIAIAFIVPYHPYDFNEKSGATFGIGEATDQ